jgi:hypothetical protein
MNDPPNEPAEIESNLPLALHRVRLQNGERLEACLSRGLIGRRRSPALPPGTPVVVERSLYDPGMCRIVEIGK